MGELSGSGGGVQGEKIAQDLASAKSEPKGEEPKSTDSKDSVEPKSTDSKDSVEPKSTDSKEPKGIETDVDGIYADAVRNDMPVFDVSPEEFNDNMKMDRKRLRFKQGSKAAEYMRKTRYNRPFWIRNTKDGYMRKIK